MGNLGLTKDPDTLLNLIINIFIIFTCFIVFTSFFQSQSSKCVTHQPNRCTLVEVPKPFGLWDLRIIYKFTFLCFISTMNKFWLIFFRCQIKLISLPSYIVGWGGPSKVLITSPFILLSKGSSLCPFLATYASPALQILPGGRSINCKTALP